MKYLVVEGSIDQIYNATSKARNDVNNILLKDDFKPLHIETNYKRHNNKYLKFFQLIDMIKNYFIWNKKISKLNNKEILIQYPLINSTIFFDQIIKKISKNNKTILLIHDLDSLRGVKKNVVLKEDEKCLNNANYIICHNERMKNKILEWKIDKNKIYCLNIFDYLYDKNIKYNDRDNGKNIVIAGNLSPQKVEYIKSLNILNELQFNLYGVGYEDLKYKNVKYCGKYLPEELLNHLDGNYGLIWDGNSINRCNGNMGEYLKYNNPHKLSLYMAAGIPVIVWNESAISSFVEKNNVGIIVNNMNDISETIEKIGNNDYRKMKNNCFEISKKLKEGYFLKKVIKEIESGEHNDR